MLDACTNPLFDGFDPAQIAAIEAANRQHKADESKARALRQVNRHKLRRAKSEAELAELLPVTFDDGETWDVISHGNIDALSYLRHALKPMHFDDVAISTWCIARADLEELAAWLDTGRIDRFTLYAGEIFKNQYGDEYELVKRLMSEYGVRFVMVRNHSKVILAANHAADYYLTVRSSANINTNPRIEQATITRSRELHDFYRDFFAGLRNIDRESSDAAPTPTAR